MNIDGLKRFGLSDQVIKRWSLDGVKYLLPIQAESIMGFGLLDGKSLIISGPGTSGKTFCGELAALHQAASRRKAVFLTPLRAIADEKFKTFHNRYSPLGLKIRLATREHTDHDFDIARARYDILVTIYEKFNSLTATDISIIKNCGCFVMDEFQIISDPRRGLELELILTKIRRFNPKAQVVILLGGGSAAERMGKWLDLPVLEETRRPVDLRLGILHRGTFHFRVFNDHTEGDERWLQERDKGYDGPMDNQSMAAIELLAGQGEQIIIFTTTRRNAAGSACYLAEQLNLPPATEAIRALSELPSSVQNEQLGRCLKGGVAFHHAELDRYQRELVESGFRRSEIKVLSSTTTLAWGVNLPAKDVFLEPMKYTGSGFPNSREMMVPLTRIDYHQAAGRAGRIGSGEKFGRAVMVASTPYEQEVLWNQYVYGRNEDPAAGFTEKQLPDLIMRLISCEAAGSQEDIENLIVKMYGAFCRNFGRDINNKIERAVSFLEKGGLIYFDKTDNLASTGLGKVASSTGISVESIIKMDESLADDRFAESLEWLFFTLDLREWHQGSGNYYIQNVAEHEMKNRIDELSNGLIERSEYLSSFTNDAERSGVVKRLATFLFILEWISGTPTRKIEILFDRGAGGLKRDASTLCWMLHAIERVLKSRKSKSISEIDMANELGKLAEGMKYGLTDDMIPQAKLLDIDREFIMRLYDFGMRTCDDFIDIDYSVLTEALPRGIIEKIKRRLKNYHQEKRPKRDLKTISNAAIEFTGEYRKLLKGVRIFGESVFLQPKLYSYLQKLWWGVLSSDSWIYKENLEPGYNQAKYICKLRRKLSEGNTGLQIVSNGRGFYRLLLPEGVNAAGVIGDNEEISINQRR